MGKDVAFSQLGHGFNSRKGQKQGSSARKAQPCVPTTTVVLRTRASHDAVFVGRERCDYGLQLIRKLQQLSAQSLAYAPLLKSLRAAVAYAPLLKSLRAALARYRGPLLWAVNTVPQHREENILVKTDRASFV